MGWSAGEIAGFIGAAAWLPHLGQWIYKSVAKSKVTVLAGPSAEIGYTTFGPIFNIRLNLSSERKNVVINRIGLTLNHESGDRRIFTWQGMRETFSHLRDASGTAVGSFDRDTEATAIKVTTDSIYDSFFRFQERKFIEAKEPLMNSLLEHEDYLRASSHGDHRDALLASEPMHRMNAFHREAFWWEPGTYTVEFEMGALTAISLKRARYSFALSTVDIDALRKNIASIPTSYEVVLKAGLEGFDTKEPTWNWRNPLIRGL